MRRGALYGRPLFRLPRAAGIRAFTPVFNRLWGRPYTMTASASSAALPLVALRGVGKTFGNGVEALAGFDLTVRPGEFLTLLGPSGCGKSTALRIVAGLAEPSRGEVAWSGAADGVADEPRRHAGAPGDCGPLIRTPASGGCEPPVTFPSGG